MPDDVSRSALNSLRTRSDDAVGRASRSSVLRVVGWVAVIAVSSFVICAYLRFYDDHTGWTYVLDFGESLEMDVLPELDSLPVHRHVGVPGYDGCFYAQLALRPAVVDPVLLRVIDNPPYRARRIALSWLASWVGGGDAWRTLGSFALISPVLWLVTGALLLQWFQPRRPDLFFRWACVMLSAGMLASLRHSLTDGPALLAIAGSMLMLEKGRPWAAACAAAVGGMTRETSILVLAAFIPDQKLSRRRWLLVLLQVLMAVLPLGLWMIHLRGVWSSSIMVGSGVANFAWPLTGYAERWISIVQDIGRQGWREAYVFNLMIHIGLTVQAAFIIARPRPQNAWWRVGAVHVLLLAVLNTQVWEGYPGASARVLLPLTLVFNMLAPRGTTGIVLLVLGNLGVVAGMAQLRPPPDQSWSVTVSDSVELQAPEHGRIEVRYESGFYGPESYGGYAWRWTSGDATFVVANPYDEPLTVRVRLGLRTTGSREVSLLWAGDEVWRGTVGESLVYADLGIGELPVDGSEITVVVEGPAVPSKGDDRSLAVAVYDIGVEVLRQGAP